MNCTELLRLDAHTVSLTQDMYSQTKKILICLISQKLWSFTELLSKKEKKISTVKTEGT